MKFHIKRTGSDELPFKGAYLEKFVVVDRRNVDSPSKVRGYQGYDEDWWYSTGSNHRVEKGCICRDVTKDGWVIDVNSLDELTSMVEKSGPVEIAFCDFNDNKNKFQINIGGI